MALKHFFNSEDGAVTVDWVVLTGAIIGLGLAVLGSISTGTTTLAGNVSTYLSDVDVGQDGSVTGKDDRQVVRISARVRP